MQVFSLHYLPCIEWFALWLQSENRVIDIHEHFVKQTYRNRTSILSANGKLDLSIPVKKQAHHTPMYQMRIENDFAWQHLHWQAIVSAYGSTPYFVYYKHHFEEIYNTPFHLLTDWNHQLLLTCSSIMKLDCKPIYSDKYLIASEHDCDLRQTIIPKKPSSFKSKPYLQVFVEKYPFQPNLSILDLLFNQGPRWNEFI